MKLSSKRPVASVRLAYMAATAGGVLMLIPAGSAQAAPMTIGELAPAKPTSYCVHGPFDAAPTGSAAAAYTVATAGIITSWSTNAGEGKGQTETFEVFRPLEAGKELIVGHDGPQALAASALNSFKTSIPVHAGDLIGEDDNNAKAAPSACIFETGNKADTDFFAEGEAADGATITPEGDEEGVRLNLTATVLAAPAISSVSPSTGPDAGNTSVTIKGTNLTEATAVKFGDISASSFAVNSETQITAVSPPTALSGPVDITVTNPGGTSATSSADRFTYTAPPVPQPLPAKVTCVVPKLKGKKLKAAKQALLKAECKLGNVMGKKNSSAKVKTQKPKPGTVLTAGSRVNVTVK